MAGSTQPDDELLRSAFEALPHQVAVIDRDFRVVFLNRVARMAFSDGEEPRRRPCHLLFHGAETPCDPESRACPLAGVAASKEPFVSRQEMSRRDGQRWVLEIDAVPLLDEAGELAGILVTIRDVNKQADIEFDLADAERRFRTLSDCAADYVFIVDPTHEQGPTIVDANEAAAIEHGYALDELIGLPMAIIDAPSTNALIHERAQKIHYSAKDGYKGIALRCKKLE